MNAFHSCLDEPQRIGQFWREEEGLAQREFGWGGNSVDDC